MQTDGRTADDTILVVEDSYTQATLLRRVLEASGYHVAVSTDGEAALDQLAQVQPVLVISDIVMPRMDGYTLCHRIKSDVRMPQVPVVLLTSLSDPHDVIRGLEVGADAFATKPFVEATLLARIRSILQNRRRGDDDGAAGTMVYFAGKEYTVATKAHQILEFLLYTYEDAVDRNQDLIAARDQLAAANLALESQTEQLRQKNAQMEEDLRLARDLQHALLPRPFPGLPPAVPPAASALRVDHLYHPSASLGGDFYSVLRVSPTQAGVFMCDVIGHGVRAALVTALIRGLMEDLAPVANNPGSFLTELNRLLASVFPGTDDVIFASAFYGVVDACSGSLVYANAGHPPPLRRRQAPLSVDALDLGPDPRAPALGLCRDYRYATRRTQLAPGEDLLVFTDGLFEAENAQRESFGEARVADALRAGHDLPMPELLPHLLTDVQRFAGRQDLEDDICLLALHWAGTPSGTSATTRDTVERHPLQIATITGHETS